MSFPQAIVFDIDDTLYPEREYVFSGYRAVADAFADRLGNADEIVARMQALFNTPDRSRVFNIIVAECRVAKSDADTLVSEMIEAYREHQPRISLTPETTMFLQELREKTNLGAISDGYLGVQQRKVDALGLADLLDEIIITDTWGREFWKPHPRAFEEIAARLCVAHDHCVYVGDNLAKDLVAPNELGWDTVLVDTPGRVHAANKAPSGGSAKHTIKSLYELTQLWA